MLSIVPSKMWRNVTLLIVAVSFMMPVSSATVKAMPFFLLSMYCTTQRNYFKGYRTKALCFLVIAGTLTLGFHGFLETKDLVMFVVCLCGISYMSERFLFKPKYLYYFFLFCILPLSLLGKLQYGNVTWIPVDGVINIFGGTSTKHGTAIAGLILLLPTLCYLFERYRGMAVDYSRKKLIFLFLLSVYIIVFSSSRSFTLSVAVLLLYLFVNRKSFHRDLSLLIFVVANASVFFMEYLQDYVVILNDYPLLADFVHVDNFEQHGVTSGRAWLWGVHMNAFLESPFLMGGGRTVTDFFVGDWLGWLGVEAQAGSESLYTGYIACYGLIGICLIMIQVYLFLYAVNMQNTLASAIMFCMIYNTTMGDSLVTPYVYDSILCYLLYFSCLRVDAQKAKLLLK